MTDLSENCAGVPSAASAAAQSLEVVICNKKGLHARASAKFVQCAEQFDAKITVAREGTEVAGTSIMGLMMLAAATGSKISISADGPAAKEALDALVALIDRKFDEDE